MPELDDDEEPQEFEMVSPMVVIQNQQQAMDRHNMALLEFRQSVNRFLDGLTAEQCHTLYRMMLNIGEGGPQVAQFFSGQLSAMLRLVHKICTSCGNTEHSTDEHMFLEMGQQEENKLLKDPPKPEVPDSQLGPEGLMEKYKVHPTELGTGTNAFRCNDCEAVYPTLEHRMKQGLRCPSCLVINEWHE